jgi:hypothetical protein
MARPPSKLQLVLIAEDGTKTKLGFGTVWRSDFEGVYNITLALPHPTEKNSAGYPEDDPIIAIKTASGAKHLIGKGKAFINQNVYEDMGAKPPYDGPGAGAPRNAPAKEEENFDDGDF